MGFFSLLYVFSYILFQKTRLTLNKLLLHLLIRFDLKVTAISREHALFFCGGFGFFLTAPILYFPILWLSEFTFTCIKGSKEATSSLEWLLCLIIFLNNNNSSKKNTSRWLMMAYRKKNQKN